MYEGISYAWNNVRDHRAKYLANISHDSLFLFLFYPWQVPVTIYYESLCDDSKTFFNEQFKPTWDLLKAYIDLELVPFGKSNSTDYSKPNQVQPTPYNANFTCHHGENECLGNKYQACILNKQYGFTLDDRINLISCLMSKLGTTVPYEQTFSGVSVSENCQYSFDTSSSYNNA